MPCSWLVIHSPLLGYLVLNIFELTKLVFYFLELKTRYTRSQEPDRICTYPDPLSGPVILQWIAQIPGLRTQLRWNRFPSVPRRNRSTACCFSNRIIVPAFDPVSHTQKFIHSSLLNSYLSAEILLRKQEF